MGGATVRSDAAGLRILAGGAEVRASSRTQRGRFRNSNPRSPSWEPAALPSVGASVRAAPLGGTLSTDGSAYRPCPEVASQRGGLLFEKPTTGRVSALGMGLPRLITRSSYLHRRECSTHVLNRPHPWDGKT